MVICFTKKLQPLFITSSLLASMILFHAGLVKCLYNISYFFLIFFAVYLPYTVP